MQPRDCTSCPRVTGPIIILIGLNLAPSAVSNASSCWWLALVSMAIIIVANIWGRGMIKIIPILLGVVGGLCGRPVRRDGRFPPALPVAPCSPARTPCWASSPS
ncbi:MAG: hypothetical protein ACLUNZ_09205 [Evtepia sp.]